jgi:phosphopantothenoylcysteine decarboxylase
MANVLLGVTGSVAAIKVPELYALLLKNGHAVRVVATQASLYFFDPRALGPGVVVQDADEWPGRGEEQRYQRGDPVLHIELRRWGDVLLIAPLDANTLAKLAYGFSDNCLTCVARAWDPARPVVLAPAMNTLMWEHPATIRHFRQLAADAGPLQVPDNLSLADFLDWINAHCPRLRIVSPVKKLLACNDEGIGALASIEALVEAVGKACEG